MKSLNLLLAIVMAFFIPLSLAQFGYAANDEFIPGDIVAVNRPGVPDQREGLVTDTFIDAYGRQVVQVQFDRGEVYQTWVPYVRKIVRKTYYTVPQEPRNYRLVEKIYV